MAPPANSSRRRRVPTLEETIHADVNDPGTSSKARAVNPADVEKLRSARTNYFVKTPKERERETKSHASTAVLEKQAMRTNNNSKGKSNGVVREWTRPSQTRRSGMNVAAKRERKDNDTSDYGYVYGRPSEEIQKDDGVSFEDVTAAARSIHVHGKRDKESVKKPSRSPFPRHPHHKAAASSSPSTSSSRWETRELRPSITCHAAGQPTEHIDSTKSAVDKRQTISRPLPVRVRPAKKPSRPTSKLMEPSLSAARSKPVIEKRQRSMLSFFAPKPPPRVDKKPVKMIECSICCNDVELTKSEKLSCNDNWCHKCLRHIFSDPSQKAQPVCCGEPLSKEFAAKVLNKDEQKVWNRKLREASEKDPLYCPRKGCHNWISSNHFFTDRRTGQKYGECRKCKTKACLHCKKEKHSEIRCPDDQSIQAVLQLADEEGWKQCPQCAIMVSRTQGCNHMTCRCGAEFCYVCGTAYVDRRPACECAMPVWPGDVRQGPFWHPALRPDMIDLGGPLPQIRPDRVAALLNGFGPGHPYYPGQAPPPGAFGAPQEFVPPVPHHWFRLPPQRPGRRAVNREFEDDLEYLDAIETAYANLRG